MSFIRENRPFYYPSPHTSELSEFELNMAKGEMYWKSRKIKTGRYMRQKGGDSKQRGIAYVSGAIHGGACIKIEGDSRLYSPDDWIIE